MSTAPLLPGASEFPPGAQPAVEPTTTDVAVQDDLTRATGRAPLCLPADYAEHGSDAVLAGVEKPEVFNVPSGLCQWRMRS